MRLWVLKKVTERNGRKIDISKLTWEDWGKKIKEEVDELVIAIKSRDKSAIAEEVMDVIQVCVGVMAKLYKECISIDKEIQRHNGKLNDRGCEIAAEIKFNISKK